MAIIDGFPTAMFLSCDFFVLLQQTAVLMQKSHRVTGFDFYQLSHIYDGWIKNESVLQVRILQRTEIIFVFFSLNVAYLL